MSDAINLRCRRCRGAAEQTIPRVLALLALAGLVLGTEYPPELVLDDIAPINASGGALRRPLIYVYEFGEKYHDYKNADIISLTNPNYAIVQVFAKMMMRAPQHITTNPEEADYFFPHVWPGFPTSPDTIVELMRKAGPWYDRKKGADHILTYALDEGRCAFGPHNGILINHFGRLSDYQPLPCYLDKTWGAKCDPAMVYLPSKHVGCHRPGHDIIVPPTVLEFRPDVPWHRTFTTGPFTHKENAARAREPKSILLFHGGKVDPRETIPPGQEHIPHNQRLKNPFESLPYSFGARQLVARMYDNVPGFAIIHKDISNYTAYLETSTFCLATLGTGWSSRYKVAITHGCIPVILQDGTMVEWEEVLPIKQYAIRVPMWMVHRLDEILAEFVKKGLVPKMQKAISCVWRLHWWRRPYGRAFELTLCELKRRLLGAPKVEIDLDACTLKCGDDKVVDLRAAYNNI